MTLGLIAGPLAGLLNRSQEPTSATTVADILQTPTELLLWWIDAVAAHSVRLPLPQFDGLRLALATGVLAVVAIRPRRFTTAASMTGWDRGPMASTAGMTRLVPVLTAVIGVVLVIGEAVPRQPAGPALLASDCLWIPHATVDTDDSTSAPAPNLRPASSTSWFQPRPDGLLSVLVVGTDCSRDVIDTVIRLRLRSIDMVVIERGDVQARVITSALTDVADVAVVLAPPLHRVKPATRLTGPAVIRGPAGFELVVEPTPNRKGLIVQPTPLDRRIGSTE